VTVVVVLLLVGSFLFLWAGSALLLSCLRWFQPRPPLSERLIPHAVSIDSWADDVELWLQQ